ncbi:hypothetical protein ACQ4M4_11235 [Leptolyngbya sp. AN02str]|uniref:hypothetical protein n=1 Tax=Leptolyngbya sp. AN02str TaxID=3423363 RepID=UPI003D32129D
MPFSVGDIVKIKNTQSLAYGRFGRINGGEPTLVEFLDMPGIADGKPISFNKDELTLIEPATSGVANGQFLYFSAVVATSDSGFRECGIASVNIAQNTDLIEAVVQAWHRDGYRKRSINL